MSSEYNHPLGVQEKYKTNDVVTVLQQYQHRDENPCIIKRAYLCQKVG